jgi:hypothetical protein
VTPQEALQFLLARGGHGDIAHMDPRFVVRFADMVQQAEEATGTRVKINELHRSPELQAQFRANYIQKPVEWNGKVYQPTRKGGLAAPPGKSRHQRGAAADIQDGPALQWMRKQIAADPTGEKTGLGMLGANDIGHIQLADRLYHAGGPRDFVSVARSGVVPQPKVIPVGDIERQPEASRPPPSRMPTGVPDAAGLINAARRPETIPDTVINTAVDASKGPVSGNAFVNMEAPVVTPAVEEVTNAQGRPFQTGGPVGNANMDRAQGEVPGTSYQAQRALTRTPPPVETPTPPTPAPTPTTNPPPAPSVSSGNQLGMWAHNRAVKPAAALPTPGSSPGGGKPFMAGGK